MTFADFLRKKPGFTSVDDDLTETQLAKLFPEFFAEFRAAKSVPDEGRGSGPEGHTDLSPNSADPLAAFGDFDFASLFGGQGQTSSTSSLDLSALSSGAGPSTVAAGFPLFESTMQLLLTANEQRLASVDQSIQIAQLFAELERVSPTRAADLAVQLGINPSQDFSFANQFGRGTNMAPASGGRVGGQVGGQNVSLPGVFSGQELSFLGSNPNVGRVVGDIADKFGLPDIFNRSQAALLPTSGSLLAQIS